MNATITRPVVIISVSGGVAEIESLPDGIDVEIRDYDNCEAGDIDDRPDYCPAIEDETPCTRCHTDRAHRREVYYPISDDSIWLCMTCEPDDVAVSPFELWH